MTDSERGLRRAYTALASVNDELRARNAELVEALKDLLDAAEMTLKGNRGYLPHSCANAKEAIAKAEGGEK